MRIGLFGGTFDPIHTGHLAMIRAAAESGALDRILVIPNAYPPHKSLEQISMATYRYEMTRIALEASNFPIPVECSDIELFRKGKSYTLDTILELKCRYDYGDEFVLIYGSDVVYEIEGWHMPRQIMKECELFFAERPGYGGEKFTAKMNELAARFSATISLFKADYIDISSTQLREMLISGDQTANDFLLPCLQKWIKQNRIYDDSSCFSGVSAETVAKLQEYECDLQKMIRRERLIHSVNTMRESVKLAFLFGGDVNKAAVAGLLHDCAKSLASNGGRSTAPKNIFGDASTSYADILHSYQGKEIAEDYFHIVDPDILNAIYYHTTARADASLLEKILFVADKIEPGRTFPGIDKIREIACRDLDDGMRACLADIINLLKREGKIPHPDSIAAYEALSEKSKI